MPKMSGSAYIAIEWPELATFVDSLYMSLGSFRRLN